MYRYTSGGTDPSRFFPIILHESSSPSEYGPVTRTLIISKTFVRLLAKCFCKLADNSGLFPDLQFGFHKGVFMKLAWLDLILLLLLIV